MSSKQYKLILFVSTLILLSGICIGVFIKNFPILEFDAKISLIEGLTFLLTIAIGVIFPLLINKWVDDNRTIKHFLVQEIEQLVEEINENEKLISRSFSEGSFNDEYRYKINYTFHSTELQMESIEKQFEVSFPNSHEILDEMKESYRTYKDYLTGGEMMISSFDKIDLYFYREHKIEYNKFESHLKEMIHKIHRI